MHFMHELRSKVTKEMELTELSSQLKTFDIVDGQNSLFPISEQNILSCKENRRLTRSQSLPKSDLWTSTSADPIKRTSKKVLDCEDEIRKIYLNNKVKLIHRNLETIFEDPVLRKGTTMFLGIGKQKRSIYLCREFRITTKQKSKIRKTKIKRLGKMVKPFKMTDDEFRKKMQSIDEFINGDEKTSMEECTFVENNTSEDISCSADITLSGNHMQTL